MTVMYKIAFYEVGKITERLETYMNITHWIQLIYILI